MGIRGFGPAIQRYGVFSSLSGESVVIDGPALVHCIFDGCLKHRPAGSGFICYPSYALLGRMVIGWLDELRNHNVNVRKIYFDGYLPPGKWSVRRERLLNQSQNMKTLVSSHPSGPNKSPEDAFSNLKADVALTRAFGRSKRDKSPKPPFIVPAVIEALRNYHDWNSLVQVVPGEADMFCAQDVRENGGIVLTSDSDLLVQDLGLKGNVSFFWDIVLVDPSSRRPGITTCKMSFHDISARLGLDLFGGLSRLAFEKQRGRMTFNQALEKARNFQDTLDSSEYRSFMEEFEMKENLPADHPVLGILSNLDPRISEVVIQTLLLKETETVLEVPSTKALRGPEILSIFLPVMIEDCGKKSAWTMCTGIRQIAYGILQDLSHRRSQHIIEYRTLDSPTSLTGRQVDIHSTEQTIQDCTHLTTTLEKLAQKLACPDLRWFAFTVYQDIVWATSEHRTPLSTMLINRALGHVEDTENYSWDLIHFTAQVQACLYSLRMVEQILDVFVFLGQVIPAPIQQLHQCLRSLPLITEWPTVEDMFSLLSKLGKTNAVAAITDMLGIPMIESTEFPTDSTSPTKKHKQKHSLLVAKRCPEDAGRSPSVNPYAVLSQASQD
ncbi:XPG domain containing-domain-containing protein [Xylariaceae sp. FL0662B]|nr:XPG domain containing-domain-containing protein [Xylariaceae sp. FL0662B]